jgi:hypothetical protein
MLFARKTEKGSLCYVDTDCKGKESHRKYPNHQTVNRYVVKALFGRIGC